MATNQTTETVEALEGAAREAAVTLASLGNAVHKSLTIDSLEQVNETIGLVLQLQPVLNRELAVCKRANPTVEVKAGRFHKHMVDLIARIDDGTMWQLDAATTFLAASFTRNTKAWASYQNHITSRTVQPSLKGFAAYQERHRLGHYNAKGELTPAGEQYDKDRAEADYKARTRKITKFDSMDFGGFLDEDATDEEKLQFFFELAYFAEAQTLRMVKRLKASDSGKRTIAAAKEKALATIG